MQMSCHFLEVPLKPPKAAGVKGAQLREGTQGTFPENRFVGGIATGGQAARERRGGENQVAN